jgi:hypothetical protein
MGLRELNLVSNKKGFNKLLRSLLGMEADAFVIFEPFLEKNLACSQVLVCPI